MPGGQMLDPCYGKFKKHVYGGNKLWGALPVECGTLNVKHASQNR